MTSSIRLLAVGAAAAAVLTTGIALADGHLDPDSAIQYRKSVMGTVGANMKGAALIVQGKVDFKDNLVAHAHAMAEAAKLAPAAFKENTDGKGGEKTTANSKVWSDWAKFEGGLKALQAEAAKLVTAAEGGDMGAIGAQLGELGKTCKGCHDNFRDK